MQRQLSKHSWSDNPDARRDEETPQFQKSINKSESDPLTLTDGAVRIINKSRVGPFLPRLGTTASLGRRGGRGEGVTGVPLFSIP